MQNILNSALLLAVITAATASLRGNQEVLAAAEKGSKHDTTTLALIQTQERATLSAPLITAIAPGNLAIHDRVRYRDGGKDGLWYVGGVGAGVQDGNIKVAPATGVPTGNWIKAEYEKPSGSYFPIASFWKDAALQANPAQVAVQSNAGTVQVLIQILAIKMPEGNAQPVYELSNPQVDNRYRQAIASINNRNFLSQWKYTLSNVVDNQQQQNINGAQLLSIMEVALPPSPSALYSALQLNQYRFFSFPPQLKGRGAPNTIIPQGLGFFFRGDNRAPDEMEHTGGFLPRHRFTAPVFRTKHRTTNAPQYDIYQPSAVCFSMSVQATATFPLPESNKIKQDFVDESYVYVALLRANEVYDTNGVQRMIRNNHALSQDETSYLDKIILKGKEVAVMEVSWDKVLGWVHVSRKWHSNDWRDGASLTVIENDQNQEFTMNPDFTSVFESPLTGTEGQVAQTVTTRKRLVKVMKGAVSSVKQGTLTFT